MQLNTDQFILQILRPIQCHFFMIAPDCFFDNFSHGLSCLIKQFKSGDFIPILDSIKSDCETLSSINQGNQKSLYAAHEVEQHLQQSSGQLSELLESTKKQAASRTDIDFHHWYEHHLSLEAEKQAKQYQKEITAHSVTLANEYNAGFNHYENGLSLQDRALIVWLLEQCQPYALVPALKKIVFERKQACQAHLEHIKYLQTQSGPRYNYLVRLQRSVNLYQQWLSCLDKQPKETKNTRWENIQRVTLLSVEKKQYLKHIYHHQNASLIVRTLYSLLSSSTLSQCEAALLEQKIRLKKRITAVEQKLVKHIDYTTFAIGQLVCLVVQQPDYQFGQLAAICTEKEMDCYQNTPILGERLPAELQQKLYAATGLTFVAISYWTSQQIGYSYYLTSAISRYCLSHWNGWSNAIDRVNHAMHFLYHDANVIEDTVLLEKETFLWYATMLFLHVSLHTGESLMGSLVSFAAALFFAEMVKKACQMMLKTNQVNKSTINMFGIISHMLVFSFTYRLTSYYVQQYLSAEKTAGGCNYQQSLSLFGLDKTSEPRLIKKRYRELSRQYHPDTGGDSQNMQSINAAYECLLK